MEVLDGIHVLREDYVNFYLIVRDGNAVLIDTGLTGKPLREYLERIGLRPSNVKVIIITHYHMDHTGGLRSVHEFTEAPIAAHREEAGLVEDRADIKPSILLEDGQTIEGLLVVHTPGHTPGHIVLIDEKTGALFIGDLAYEEDGRLVEIPHRYSLDPEMNRRSIRRLLDYEFKHVLPSHGRPLLGSGREKVEELVKELGLG
jgi:glyoxylase-like metal-dependent hydrolase (beta-lactamase superfamily II)